MGCSDLTVLIGRTGFDTILSVPDPTLSLRSVRPWYQDLASINRAVRRSGSPAPALQLSEGTAPAAARR